ncbi:unnamed protein product, partial [Calicophoron daubneyi]
PDNPVNETESSPQTIQHIYSDNSDNAWRLGGSRTAGVSGSRGPGRETPSSSEARNCDLLSSLVANELAESSMGGTFSPSKSDCGVGDGGHGVLALRENNNMFSAFPPSPPPVTVDLSSAVERALLAPPGCGWKKQRGGQPMTWRRGVKKETSVLARQTRRIPRVPYKVLDAPELQDDFYLNLVDWSSQNVLAVGLGTCVYLWNAFTSQVTRLCDVSGESDVISSVAWSKKGCHLAIGTYRGHVQIWDVTRSSCLRSLNGHIARVGALAWNADLLASGSRDRYILLRDTRASASSGGGPSDPLPNADPSSSSTLLASAGELTERELTSNPISNSSTAQPHVTDMDTSPDDDLLSGGSIAARTGSSTPMDTTMSTESRIDDVVASHHLDFCPRWTNSSSALNGGIAPGTTTLPGLDPPDSYVTGGVRVLRDHRQEKLVNQWMAVEPSDTMLSFVTAHDASANAISVPENEESVCGLKWSPDSQYLASGGNDNRLLVWSQHAPPSGGPVLTYEEHVAAVKAIAWSPHQHGLLASGGGTADRCIRFWNTLTGQALRSVDTGSQVCNIAWSIHSNELVSTHGYSQNQILVWRYPSLTQLVKLTGHSYRVLYLAISPDGENIVTGAGDETLRFWNIFTRAKTPKPPPSSLNLFNGIR